MLISQKDRYALRALFELAKRHGGRPIKVAEIAAAQAVPARFLEVILTELKQAGFVTSRRGRYGGYLLAREPADLTIGEVIRFLEGPVEVASCAPSLPYGCPPGGYCALEPVWQQVAEAITSVFDGTTFADLVEQEERRAKTYVPAYAI